MNWFARWFGTEAYNDSSIVLARGFDGWMLPAVVIACVSAIVLAWLGTARLPSLKARVLLLLPRAAAVVLIGCIAVQPELELRRSIRLRNSVAVIVDTSQSMSIRARPDHDSRAQSVTKLLQQHRDFFDDLEKELDVEYYSLAEELIPVERTALEAGLPPPGRRSALVAGLKKAVASLSESRLQAVLFLTDGVDTEEGMPSQLAHMELPPVYVFAPTEDAFKDVEIAEVRRDDFAFIRTPWSATAILRVRGYANKEIPVTLKQGDSIVLSQTVRTRPGQQNIPLRFHLVPKQTGRFFYTLSVPRYADEAVHRNNELTFALSVVRDKIRVLHVCGQPSWDARFLRRALKLDPNIDLVSLFILRTPTDIVQARSNELSLIPFPVNAFLRDDLASFDLVIFQNFAYGPYRVAPYLPFIRDYVRYMHGAFVMIGGNQSFAEGKYFATPIEEILPVDVPPPGDTIDDTPFRVRLTPNGKRHPITTLEPDTERSVKAWSQLPELDGYNKLTIRTARAVTLADHPQTGAPIIVVGEAMTGRTMAIAVDSLWRWNFLSVGAGGSNRHYLSFWKNGIRWLIRDPSLDMVRLSTPRDTCFAGERIDVSAEVLDHTYKPVPKAGISYELQRTGDTTPVKKGTADADAQGRWEYRHAAEKPGLYTLRVTARNHERELGVSALPFHVKTDDTEYAHPAVSHDFAEQVAALTGGRTFDLSSDRFRKEIEIDNPKTVRLLDRKSIPLWNTWVLLGIAVLLLSLEWALRRRAGLS